MHEDDLKMMKSVEEILEKELRQEMKKVVDANAFVPGQSKTLTDAVCLMLKMKELERWVESENSERSCGMHSYNPNRSSVTGRYTSNGMNAYSSYEMGYSGHSTKDRMIARLEDMMGEAKNEYEARMIRDAIVYIQNNNA